MKKLSKFNSENIIILEMENTSLWKILL